MFEISEGALPVVRTRKALLILDLQTDFVASEGALHVDKPADYVEKICNLASTYRDSGPVIWVRSQFAACRPVNDGTSTGDRVITDNELTTALQENAEPARRGGIPSKTLLRLYDEMLPSQEDDEGDMQESAGNLDESYDNETYLTPKLGKKPQCALPLSSGEDYALSITHAMDLPKDRFLTKTHYSAFKDSPLLQLLRGQFVTELFICGALTNISIFATAMDAAQFGYSITLLEDCLGYRSKARHDEAIRQLVETAGCEVMSSLDIVEALRPKESTLRPSSSRRPVRGTHDHRSLNSMITNLKLRNDTSTTPAPNETPTEEVSSSRDALISGTQATASHDSLQPASAPSTSNDSIAEMPPLPKKPEGDNRKRVPSKIRSRRRPSKSHSNEAEQQGSGLPKVSSAESQKDAISLISPAQVTLRPAAEVIGRLSTRASPDENLLGSTTSNIRVDPIIVSQVKHEIHSPAVQDKEILAEEKGETKFQENKEPVVDSIEQPTSLDPAQETSPKQEDDCFPICDGDSEIIHNLLPLSESGDIFERVRDEVRWQKMSHQGGDVPRLVSVQGEIGEDGSIPIYRHPADESPPLLPFTPAVSLIRAEVEKRLGHRVNHCLIQFYRNGTDYISEHSDKTLDIAPDSFIANVSLGALRAMTFRTKRPLKDQNSSQNEEKLPRLSCKVPLPHNSLCKMSLRTNMKWLHGIRQDKRASREKSEAELAYNMGRISLTFRLIATFLDGAETKIWGQGAAAKERKDARTVTNGGSPQAEKMLWAFGKENHSSDFDWKEAYGQGFDVLHIQNQRKLFLSGNNVTDLRVKLMLSELELNWSAGELSPFFYWKQGEPHAKVPEVPEDFPVRFVDNDLSRARAQGDLSILLYLDATYRAGQESRSRVQIAHQYTRLQEADAVLQGWLAVPFSVNPFRRLLALWDGYASEDVFIAGPTLSVADCAFWPVLHEVMKEWGEGINSPSLQGYYERMLRRESVQNVVGKPVIKE